MSRRFSLPQSALALATLGLFALAAPRAAAQGVPFHADGTFTFTHLNGRQVDVSGDGRASPGGPLTFHDTVTAYFGAGGRVVEVEGTITFVFAGGELRFFYEAEVDATGFVSGEFAIVGGTGLFEGASGGGTIAYPIGQGAPFWMDGTLTF